MIPTLLSGVLGDEGRRINCTSPSGFHENLGAVKAAADTADLGSTNTDQLGALCNPGLLLYLRALFTYTHQ